MSDEEIEDKDKIVEAASSRLMSVLLNPQKGKTKEGFIADIEKGYHLGDILYSKRDDLYERWEYKYAKRGQVK